MPYNLQCADCASVFVDGVTLRPMLCTLQFALHSLHSALYALRFALYSLRFASFALYALHRRTQTLLS